MMRLNRFTRAIVTFFAGGEPPTERERGRQYVWDELNKGRSNDDLWREAMRDHSHDFNRGMFDVLNFAPSPAWAQQRLEELWTRMDKWRTRAGEHRARYENACETIAKMHAAAVGSTRGPRIGVVEDVAAMREELERIRVLYTELLYTVEAKTPNESRHESALRLLRDAQAFRAAQQGGHVNGF